MQNGVAYLLIEFLVYITEPFSDGLQLFLDGLNFLCNGMHLCFKVAERKARIGRNPQTGKEINIAACKVPKFVAAKALKEAVK